MVEHVLLLSKNARAINEYLHVLQDSKYIVLKYKMFID